MTQDKSREAFENSTTDIETDDDGYYKNTYTQVSWRFWRDAWKASRADVLAMLESEDVVKYIAAMVNPDPNGGYMAHHLRTAKAVLAAVAEKVRGE